MLYSSVLWILKHIDDIIVLHIGGSSWTDRSSSFSSVRQVHTAESCFHEKYLAENHKFALFPSACLTLSTQHDLLHPPCIICVSRQCVFCKTQWGPQQQGQERPASPQYSNQVQSACLTLLALSGPWPAWLWWLSARSQLRSQAIKWGQALLFRGTHYSETICLDEMLHVSVSKNWSSFYKEYTNILYFPEYILKSHLNLSFIAHR